MSRPGNGRAEVLKVASLSTLDSLAYLGSPEAVKRTLQLEDWSVKLDAVAATLNAVAEDMGRELDKLYRGRGQT